MPTYNHFYDLPVYKTCRSFRKKVSSIARKYFPKSEEYLLKGQILDASRSITANIAEGFGRFHHQENTTQWIYQILKNCETRAKNN